MHVELRSCNQGRRKNEAFTRSRCRQKSKLVNYAIFFYPSLIEYLLFTIFFTGAIGLYIFDFITDWLNAFNAYWFRIDEKGEDYRFYFGLTVAVITMPSIVMQVGLVE